MDMLPRREGGQRMFMPVPGGSPYNVALALGRLGVPVRFLCSLSRDTFGEWLAATLTASHVDISLCPRTAALTTLGFVHLAEKDQSPRYEFYTEGTAAGALVEADLPSKFPEETACLHFGSFSLAQEPVGSTLEVLLERRDPGQLVSVDPNVRPFLIRDRDTYERRLDRFLAAADLIKLSLEDLHWLQPGLEPEACCDRYLERGAKLVIVTRGGDGALGATARARVKVPASPVKLVDPVGAGDVFQAAVLGWLLRDGPPRQPLGELGASDLEALLAFATQAAAICCARAGCDPPWLHELERDSSGVGPV